MELRGRWWNGRWGRLARRDIWLKHDQVWRVEARKGDSDSKVWTHDYPTEAQARAAITGMINRTGGAAEWQDITAITTAGPVKAADDPPKDPADG